MNRTRLSEIRLRDPITEITRKERRILLGVSALGVLMVKIGLLPSKISALGIEFTQTDRRSLLMAVAAAEIYFLIAFLIYASSDFVAWRIAYFYAVKALSDEVDSRQPGEEDKIKRRYFDRRFGSRPLWLRLSRPASLMRAAFEFALPIVFGIYTIIILIKAAS